MPSEIRTYLEQKAAEPEKEWLRREPATTHPAILRAVRAFQDAGGFYDDDAERYVEDVAGDLPEHRHHGHEERHRLTVQLGHEVYIAKGVLGDEERKQTIQALLAEGFAPLKHVDLTDGGRYVVRFPTVYVGHRIPTFSGAQAVRAKRSEGRWFLLPKGARVNGYAADPDALIRAGWEVASDA